jgi:hypothetical protein
LSGWVEFIFALYWSDVTPILKGAQIELDPFSEARLIIQKTATQHELDAIEICSVYFVRVFFDMGNV